MPRLDHISVPVKSWAEARDWYTQKLGFELVFEIPERMVCAVKDNRDFAIFFHQAPVPDVPIAFALTMSVPDVHAAYKEISANGVKFAYAPQKLAWGYGAEILDPNGYRICLWDETSMAANT